MDTRWARGYDVETDGVGRGIAIGGQPKTEEVIPTKALNESVSKAAYAYTEKHIGPKEKIGNKGGGLGNRIRAVLQTG